VRQYIKGWITHWDLQRLGGQAGRLVSGTIASNYTEDASLEDPPSADDAPGLDAPGLDPS
jgi:hypothetical protein